MDVNRVNGNGYQAPPPPMPGSGEFAPAPEVVAVGAPAPPPPPIEFAAQEPRGGRNEERDTLRRAVDEINSSIAIYRRHLGIRHHEPSNRRIITVYDSDTNEAIRQIPPESVLEAHANMLEMVGLFMDTRG
jgi:flagellar protein FlaG